MTFQETLTAAVADFTEHGFDSAERLEAWIAKLRQAALREITPVAEVEAKLTRALTDTFKKQIDDGAILKHHPDLPRYTLDRIRPALRGELDRRILANRQLVKLNREKAMIQLEQRFSGWASSVPAGGSDVVDRVKVKKDIRKSLAQLPFTDRRLAVDQGHKLVSAINEVVAKGGGAIAARFHSHWRERGYDFRPNHKARDDKVYIIRGSWADEKGLLAHPNGYTDQITQPGEEPFCLPGDVSVEWFHDAEKAFRRWYDGPMLTISTASGKVLRTTPNHPVLTPQGWIAAGSLNEGDQIVEIGNEGGILAEKDTQERVARFSDVFAAARASALLHEVRQGMAVDFHGDGSDEEVDIVTLTGCLSENRKADASQPLGKFRFPVTDLLTASVRVVHEGLFRLRVASNSCLRSLTDFVLSSGDGALDIAFVNSGRTDTRQNRMPANPRLGGEHLQRLTRQEPISENIARNQEGFFQARTKVDKPCLVVVPEGHWADPNGLRDLTQGEAVSTQTGYVQRVDRHSFSGHVFNLQTASGWYGANGIIVSNCRCFYEYIYSLSALPDDCLSVKGRSELARVRAVT